MGFNKSKTRLATITSLFIKKTQIFYYSPGMFIHLNELKFKTNIKKKKKKKKFATSCSPVTCILIEATTNHQAFFLFYYNVFKCNCIT